ncbi:hypothetical protein [Nocardiopsis sp. RV163]|uniref:hypothetical protein n=1 Tax=Nocardiopsis sp. RV163 TaxID=1661388 RepID=UPI00064B9FA3|nr:hypothetical protein [Nocardiopsis sp. RV163]
MRLPRRTRSRPLVVRALAVFDDARWRAAQQGYVLTRQKRLLGAVYALTSLDGDTAILHDLGEVRAFLERPS